jgi:hypothetical protein
VTKAYAWPTLRKSVATWAAVGPVMDHWCQPMTMPATQHRANMPQTINQIRITRARM